MIAVAPGVEVALELRARLADLYCAYDDALNDGALERWPEFFAEACVYKVIAARECRAGIPHRADLLREPRHADGRVVALRETALFAPRIARRITSGVCVRAIEADGLRLTASFAVFQTMPDQPSSCSCAAAVRTAWSRTAERCALPNGSV